MQAEPEIHGGLLMITLFEMGLHTASNAFPGWEVEAAPNRATAIALTGLGLERERIGMNQGIKEGEFWAMLDSHGIWAKRVPNKPRTMLIWHKS